MSHSINDIVSMEIASIKSILTLPPQEQYDRWEEYQQHFDSLPEDVKPIVYYEHCKMLPERSTSGFHGLLESGYSPFGFCGWADYGGRFVGVAFRINSECFADHKAELYYTDDDMMGDIGKHRVQRLNDMLGVIRSSSSGIDNIRLHQEQEDEEFIFRGMHQEPCTVRSFRFTLDAARIREYISFNGEKIPSEKLGGYVFVLPKAGEFFCELGEIIDGRRVPLLYDDFCMK